MISNFKWDKQPVPLSLIKIVVENSFYEIREEKLEKAKSLIKQCDFLIDSGVDLVGINSRNYELLEYTLQEGIEVLSLRNESIGLKLKQYENISSIVVKIRL